MLPCIASFFIGVGFLLGLFAAPLADGTGKPEKASIRFDCGLGNYWLAFRFNERLWESGALALFQLRIGWRQQTREWGILLRDDNYNNGCVEFRTGRNFVYKGWRVRGPIERIG